MALKKIIRTPRLIGESIYKISNPEISFLHVGLERNGNKEGHSWGVVELDSLQLQIGVTEYLNSLETTDDFLQDDIEVILKSLQFEQ